MLLGRSAVCAVLLWQLTPLAAFGANLDDALAITPTPPDAVENELIFPRQGKHVHSSSIVELPNGSLLAAWFIGSGERKADDVCVMGARKASPGASWSEPFVLADTPGHPDCNPVLWIDKDKQLWLFWSTILSNQWDSSLVKYRVSTDYLSTAGAPRWQWQDTVHVKPNNFQNEMLSHWPKLLESVAFFPRAILAEVSTFTFVELLRDKWETILVLVLVLVLANYLAYRVHRWRQRRTGSGGWPRFVYRSCACYTAMAVCGAAAAIGYFAFQSHAKLNHRLGWLTANQPLQLQSGEIVLPLYSDRFVASMMVISSDGGTSWEASRPMVGYGSIQPTLLERSNGQLVAMMRENGVRKRIRYSVSDNQGRDWSAVHETDLPNPGSKINVAALKNGNWVLAYNDLVDGRHSLSLAISHDEGATWKPFKTVESVRPGEASFSYPCVVQSNDGRIHLTYSSNHHRGKEKGEAIRYVSLGQPEMRGALSEARSTRGIVR